MPIPAKGCITIFIIFVTLFTSQETAVRNAVPLNSIFDASSLTEGRQNRFHLPEEEGQHGYGINPGIPS